MNTSALVGRCINGEKAAWDRFVERFSAIIFWAIKRRLQEIGYHYGQNDLEDIFQNVFVLLWEKGKLRQVRNREQICTWLRMVAANCALNYFRGARAATNSAKETLTEKDIESSGADYNPNRALLQEKLYDKLAESLQLLSVRERIILKLNYLHGKTHQEIGTILKVPANTVSSIMQRTKEKLKEKLQLERENLNFF